MEKPRCPKCGGRQTYARRRDRKHVCKTCFNEWDVEQEEKGWKE